MNRKFTGIVSLTLAGLLTITASDIYAAGAEARLAGEMPLAGISLTLDNQVIASGIELLNLKDAGAPKTQLLGITDGVTGLDGTDETADKNQTNDTKSSQEEETSDKNKVKAASGEGMDIAPVEEDPGQAEGQEEPKEEEKPAGPVEEDDSRWENWGIAKVDNYLNIREKPSEEGKIIGKLPKNAGCYINEVTKDGWAKIKSGKVSGYVSTDYLVMGDEVPAMAKKVGTQMAIVTTETLFVREEPNTDCKILTMVPEEEELEVIKIKDGWVKVYVDNDKGWVSAEYVKLSYELDKAVSIKELEVGDGSNNTTTSLRADIVAYAQKFLGNRYVYGGTSLTGGIDCSGFTMRVYEHFGYSIPRTSTTQAGAGTTISLGSIRPGDLLFYGNGYGISHVAIYIGNGQIIHASNPRSGIKISNAYYRTPVKAVKIIND
ncbi:SH3 domain-containing C40 family peptidase [Anaerolentibacter hominis]|uniref:C40 family peptidase n=1 Tax=Anaerolentibacter hominis TaxID=3079009 RepID=UPI0031B84D20